MKSLQDHLARGTREELSKQWLLLWKGRLSGTRESKYSKSLESIQKLLFQFSGSHPCLLSNFHMEPGKIVKSIV